MLENSFGVQLSYASVDRGDGADARQEAVAVLAARRVLGAVRDASAVWSEGDETVLAVPVTDAGGILTLADDDTIATTTTVDDLRAAFADAGLNLWLSTDDAAEVDDDAESSWATDEDGESDQEHGESDQEDADEDDIDPALFAPAPVRVDAFSHRGPAVARLLAEANRTTIEHIESGAWSRLSFRTTEPTSGWVSSRADLPVIELNRTEDGGSWIEVTAGAGTVPFWTDAERDTRPVLDISAITVAETVEVYRRLLTEGDGSRDELAEIAASVPLDVDSAHRALIAEELGGVAGTEQRQRAFLAAFGIPSDLIDQAFAAGGELGVRRFEPVGWPRAVGDTLVAGLGELAPLTRRDTLWQRVTGAIRRRPALGVAIAVGELTFGVWATRRFRGVGRAIGVLTIVDAIGEIVLWVVRLRRR